mmetsp:Transcript_4250/g.13824  ORF Transcript_4250/g.13824 Transcript_4250/m.13824 type:complete len:282 (+) Transcript_4250:2767-3612(+)
MAAGATTTPPYSGHTGATCCAEKASLDTFLSCTMRVNWRVTKQRRTRAAGRRRRASAAWLADDAAVSARSSSSTDAAHASAPRRAFVRTRMPASTASKESAFMARSNRSPFSSEADTLNRRFDSSDTCEADTPKRPGSARTALSIRLYLAASDRSESLRSISVSSVKKMLRRRPSASMRVGTLTRAKERPTWPRGSDERSLSGYTDASCRSALVNNAKIRSVKDSSWASVPRRAPKESWTIPSSDAPAWSAPPKVAVKSRTTASCSFRASSVASAKCESPL